MGVWGWVTVWANRVGQGEHRVGVGWGVWGVWVWRVGVGVAYGVCMPFEVYVCVCGTQFEVRMRMQ